MRARIGTTAALLVLLSLAVADDGGKMPFGKDYAAGMEQARRSGKPAVIYFTADW